MQPYYILSRICRNLHRDIEIDRNQRFEEIKGRPEKFYFQGVEWGWEGFPYEGEVRKCLIFWGWGLTLCVYVGEGRGVNFQGEVHNHLHTL